MNTPNAAVGGLSVRGLLPTIYDGNGGAYAGFVTAREALKRAQPQAVQIHSWDAERAAEGVRITLPRAQVIVGYGVDGIARAAALKNWTEAQAVAQFRELAARASRLGAECIVWNAEASWKAPPDSEQRKRLEGAIRAGLAAVLASYPHVIQGHTSYSHPSLHSSYPWRAWLGPGSPITFSAPQVYAAPEGNVMAHVGALGAREVGSLASWGAGVRAGWIRPDAPGGSPDDMTDCDWLPYYQLHHVRRADTVRHALEHPVSLGWALPTRADAEGTAAFLVAHALLRLGYTGQAGISQFQTAHGLAADGIVGLQTTEAALRALDALNGEGKALAGG